MKVAIVGSGISGLVCAHYLNEKFDVEIFEANDYIGGHTNTIEVETERGILPVDTGFIVFNHKTYPNFLKLLGELNVAYQATSMSFSVKCDQTGLEYNGTSLNTLFAQRKNLFSPRFHRMIAGILKFNKAAKKFLQGDNSQTTFREFVNNNNLPDELTRYYVIPMAAAVWSANPEQMWHFPARFMLQFWENHGFLEINDRPQWYTIKGGSYSYVKEIIKPFNERIHLNCPVTGVKRRNGKVTVETPSGPAREFDKIIFATHSDQALAILDEPSANEKGLLSSIPYQKNKALLHTETRILPKTRRAWAAWNYHLPQIARDVATVTYNMNILQNLEERQEYNVSINCPYSIADEKIIREIDYDHPVFTLTGIEEQKRYDEWIGEHDTYFCGAYLRNGFHEDGVVSALKVCEKLGVLS